MGRHRSSARPPAASTPTLAVAQSNSTATRPRAPSRLTSLRGRVVVAVVAAGAAAVAGQALAPPGEVNAATHDVTLAAATGAPLAPAPQKAPASGEGPAARALAAPNVLPNIKAAAPRPLYVLPAAGTFSSGFGSRWGTEHHGDDIANAVGTPIVSVTDGVVLDAGPASGFGLWVRVQNTDGTTAVYGHVHETIAKAGQHVKAGEQIATMGNRGESTGPHLHFEIWQNGKDKIDPQPWLASHGLNLGPVVG